MHSHLHDLQLTDDGEPRPSRKEANTEGWAGRTRWAICQFCSSSLTPSHAVTLSFCLPNLPQIAKDRQSVAEGLCWEAEGGEREASEIALGLTGRRE